MAIVKFSWEFFYYKVNVLYSVLDTHRGTNYCLPLGLVIVSLPNLGRPPSSSRYTIVHVTILLLQCATDHVLVIMLSQTSMFVMNYNKFILAQGVSKSLLVVFPLKWLIYIHLLEKKHSQVDPWFCNVNNS